MLPGINQFTSKLQYLLLCMLLCFCASMVRSDELKVFGIFSDHGILQQDTEAPIWGTADAHAGVTVTFRGATATATADATGAWMAHLRTPKAVPGEQDGTDLVITAGSAKLVLHDVVVGEIWLGSGQSNMDSELNEYEIGQRDIPNANYPSLRFYSGGGCMFDGDFSRAAWNRCTPEVARSVSAVGFYFSRELQQKLQVPVGFVKMAFSGSPLGSWVLPEWLRADARTVAQFNIAEAGKIPFFMVGGNFLKQVQPIMPFAVKGILWDQGESGIQLGTMSDYYAVFDIMVQHWRKGFGRDLPVVYCQMPKGGAWGPTTSVVIRYRAYFMASDDPIPLAALPQVPPKLDHVFNGFASEPDVFVRMMALSQCYMAITRDLDKAVHPPDKDHYGHRFALTALTKVYGLPEECYGPVMVSAKREGANVRVSFDHIGSGLVAFSGNLQGFVVTGTPPGGGPVAAIWPQCRIDGDQVVLAVPNLETVEMVGYAPSQDQEGGRVMWANLFNKEGLPAYPMTMKVQ